MKPATKMLCSLLVLGALLGASLPALAAAAGVVNVNTAGAEELALLPRIGPTVAQRIVEFREANGRFKTAEDLMLVKGIGERTFELIRPYVVLNGDTTLKEKVSSRPASDSTTSNG